MKTECECGFQTEIYNSRNLKGLENTIEMSKGISIYNSRNLKGLENVILECVGTSIYNSRNLKGLENARTKRWDYLDLQ